MVVAVVMFPVKQAKDKRDPKLYTEGIQLCNSGFAKERLYNPKNGRRTETRSSRMVKSPMQLDLFYIILHFLW